MPHLRALARKAKRPKASALTGTLGRATPQSPGTRHTLAIPKKIIYTVWVVYKNRNDEVK